MKYPYIVWKSLLQIATAHFITNCDKGLLQIATGTLLQIATSFITNRDRYYKLRQPLLQIATVHTPPPPSPLFLSRLGLIHGYSVWLPWQHYTPLAKETQGIKSNNGFNMSVPKYY